MAQRQDQQGQRTAAIALGAAIVVIAIARVRMPNQRTLGDQPPPLDERPWPDMRIDLNTATLGELTALPGIGPTLGERIIADRAAQGPFASVDELQRVDRIGPVLVGEIGEFAVAEPHERTVPDDQ